MFGTFGWPELLLILALVLLIFGVGRIARVGGELGKGVSAFREGMKEGQEKADEEAAEEKNTHDNPTV
jgi:sec-independent protein translocase protein TatA